MKKILVFLPVLLILMSGQILGQVSRTAVPFLLIAPGARAGGMGETFVAIADDATATHWNPAGLGRYPLSPDWINLAAEPGQKIEAIALVENNLPEINYEKYDVWAVIDGKLAKWDKNSWATVAFYDLAKSGSIKSILYRYTGVDEEEMQPYYEKLSNNYYKFSSADIDLLKSKIQGYIPAGYEYSNEINAGFEKLENDWLEFKLSVEGYRKFEKMVDSDLSDSTLTKAELDSIAFGFDMAERAKPVREITIPYSIVFDSPVNCLESNGGRLYAGTDDGFYKYDPERNRWSRFGLADSLSSTKITSLARYRRRSILVGTDSGLVYFDGANIKTFEPEENPPKGNITAVTAVSDYNIWAATDDDLYHFDGKGWSDFYTYTVVIGDDLDKIGRKFYGQIAKINSESINQGIKDFNQLEGELNVGDTVKLPYKLALKGDITALGGMGDMIWIGTERGVILSTGTQFTYFGYKEYVAEEDMSVDDVARAFLGSNDPQKIEMLSQMIRQYNNLDGDRINAGQTVMVYANTLGAPTYSIAAPSSKKAYIGTAFGVVEYDDGMWSRFPKAELSEEPVNTILTESGEIWFSSEDRVLIRARAMKQITYMHSNYLVQLADDLYYEFFSFVYPTSEWGTFGLGITFLSFGSQDRTGEYGEDLGQFNSYDMAITLSYGTRFMDNMSAGLSARYINSHLADVGAGQEKGKGVGFSFAVDGGILYDFNERLTLATTVTNIGPEIAYIDADQADPLPSKLSLAAAYKIVNSPFNRLTVVGEASKLLVDLNDDINTEINEIIPHVGIEYWYSNYVALRGGYIYDDVGRQKYFTTGASLQYNNLRFDFSYVPSSDERYNRMGNTMRFSMNVEF